MFANVTLSLMGGFVTTIQLFLSMLVFALPLGLIISFGSMSRFTPLRALVKTVVWAVRGTPLMLQIIVIFYCPALLWGMQAPRFGAALLSFVINYACYFSEIFRGGIQAIPNGQYEAGQVLGMTKTQIFFKITLLQVIKRIIPPMGNEFINLVKDTALARTIAVYEVLWMRKSSSRARASSGRCSIPRSFTSYSTAFSPCCSAGSRRKWTILSKEAPKCLFLRSRTCIKTLARPRF